jgi:hypothetical protein
MNTITLIRPFLTVATLGLLATSGVATAEEIKVMLSGDMEVPPVTTMASGSGSITINPDMTVSGGITTAGVTATAAHIHVGKAGVNGPVAVGLTRSGDNAWRVPDGAKFDANQFQAYKDGALYVNVHSAANKGGEIRGQLMPAMAGK